MKIYDTAHIKNVALVGHAGSGKTTLAEAMLFESGTISRIGSIEDKNTASDYHELEQERGNSIYSSLLHAEWKDNKINVIDTPGFEDFIGDVVSALKVVDTAVMVLNANHGVEVGSEQVWEYVDSHAVPTIFAVNQIDGENANFDRTVEQAKARFGRKVTVVQYPLNQGDGFNAIVDVLKMTMYEFGPDGGKPEKKEIPEAEKAKADQLHNELVETVAESDESLMEKYFEQGSLDEDDMIHGLKASLLGREMYPVFVCSSKRNMGSGRIMGFINNAAPSADEREGTVIEGEGSLACDATGPEVLFVFKTLSVANLGDLSFFKVCSGTARSGADLVNAQTSDTERLNQLFVMDGKERVNVDELQAGDIGATVKLKSTHTNNTLAPKGNGTVVKPIEYPEPTIRTAVVSNAKGEEEKLASALHHIKEEDPTVVVEHSQELKQLILHGQGEMHLAIIKWKLEHIYKLDIDFVEPKISYRETISKPAKASYKHKKQSGGAGQFAEVHILMEPYYEGMPDPPDLTVRGRDTHELKWGGTLEFFNCIVGGAIDAKYMSAIQKGFMEKMEEGPLTECHVRDIRVSVYDGKMHAVDSNDMAFKTASMMAFKEAFMNADPKLLEPIYDIEVTVPDDMMGDVMSDLQTRRAIIQGMEAQGHNQVLKAKVPLAELYKYSSALRSLTQGRAKHKRKFADYELVPANIQQDIIASAKQELQEA